MEIEIKYVNDNMLRLEKINKGDWIDLRASKGYKLKAGDFVLIDLGVAMKLPEGYEAHILPRSSTFKNYGLLQTNGMGIVDNSYSGDNDWWKFPVYATRDTQIYSGDRVCQFRIVESQPAIEFKEVEHLKDKDRGGFGSTGVK